VSTDIMYVKQNFIVGLFAIALNYLGYVMVSLVLISTIFFFVCFGKICDDGEVGSILILIH